MTPNRSAGLSLVEVVVSVVILGIVFVFITEIFLSAITSTRHGKHLLLASHHAEGITERLRTFSAELSGSGVYYYDLLHTIYSPADPYNATRNAALFGGTIFDQTASYVAVFDENADPGNPLDDQSKKIVIHLEWDEGPITGGNRARKFFTATSLISRPASSFPRRVAPAILSSLPTTTPPTLPPTTAPPTTGGPTTTPPTTGPTTTPPTTGPTTVPPTTTPTTTNSDL